MSTLQQTAQPSLLESLLEQIAANQNLQNLLASLPDRTRRSVMVPFGAVAFFPGQLVHTNECFVNMGADVIAEKSTKETVNLLKQRQLQLEAQVTALNRQQPAVRDSGQQAGIVAASQAILQSPEDEEQMLDIREPYDEHFHGQLQTSTPSKHMQRQLPHATVTRDTTVPSSGSASEKPNSPTHQAVDAYPAHPDCNSGGKECRPSLQQAHATDRVAAGGAAPDAAGIAVGGTSGAAAGGAVGSAAGVAVGDAAGAAAGSVEEPNTLRQQACATDDGEFEKMMAKFDDLDRQEAAAAGRALAAGASGSTHHPTNLQQESPVRQQQQQKPTITSSSTPPSVNIHHVRPPTGLKRGFLSGKASRPNSKASLPTVRASSAGQGTSGAGQGTSRAGQGVSGAGQGISSAVESQLQHDSARQSSKPAFTGSIVERMALSTGGAALDEPPVNVQQSSSGSGSPDTSRGLMVASSTGQVAQKAAPRRVSKFKQSRNAK